MENSAAPGAPFSADSEYVTSPFEAETKANVVRSRCVSRCVPSSIETPLTFIQVAGADGEHGVAQ